MKYLMPGVFAAMEMYTMYKMEKNLDPSMKEEEKKKKASEIILNHVGFSLGGGLVPIPGGDIITVSAIQVNMLRQLSKLYNVPFVAELGRNIISAVVGSSLARLGASLVKVIPGVGTLIGSLSMPVLSGASTYALGQVVTSHFQNGGTLADLDFSLARKRYKDTLEEAREVVKDIEKQPETSDDPMDRIKKLSELHEAGILSDEEFKEQKAKLLERL